MMETNENQMSSYSRSQSHAATTPSSYFNSCHECGLSTTLWTKVPKQILNNPKITDQNFSPNSSSGHLDGCIDFQPFDHGSRISYDLRLGGTLTIKPEVGKMFIFPSWLLHSVYPFEGEGERRTVASNINIWN